MLTAEQRRQAEAGGAASVRRHWTDVGTESTLSLMDEIRHRVVEEGWFGRQVTGDLQSVRQEAVYGRHPVEAVDLHGSTERDIHGNSVARDVYGNDRAREFSGQAPSQQHAPEATSRDGPEAGR